MDRLQQAWLQNVQWLKRGSNGKSRHMDISFLSTAAKLVSAGYSGGVRTTRVQHACVLLSENATNGVKLVLLGRTRTLKHVICGGACESPRAVEDH